ncbi:MAG: TIGR02710 family CRISPR-associated protein [Syntrophomonadaceae bacterium]|nr:TIGR02710 family CRISPR-associated protein [Syntrophomonadaceae bacterium]
MTRARVLIISVGGSPAPIINACREYRPDFTYFFCSGPTKGPSSSIMVDGPGNPCGDNRYVDCHNCKTKIPLGDPIGPAIVRQLGWDSACYEKIEVNDPDDLSECFEVLSELKKRIHNQFGSGAEVAVNYTGGTKTMSVALAFMGILQGQWEITINKGSRGDLIKVRGGDIPVIANTISISLALYETQVTEFLRRYDYSSADEILSQITLRQHLSSDKQEKILRLRRLCQAFHAWDMFDHSRSLDFLRIVGGRFVTPYIEALTDLTGVNRRATGYEEVVDLVFNAERCSVQGRYDDAVARLYRAVEMLAQKRLENKWGIDTSRVELDKIPENLRNKYRGFQQSDDTSTIRIALRRAYELLAELNDPVGLCWQKDMKKLLTSLEKRNNSILAHGIIPLGEEDYMQVENVLQSFINEVLKSINVKTRCLQLPSLEIMEM